MSRLEDIGEEGFLKALPSWIKHKNLKVKTGIGDDALILENGYVVTSDAYEDGVHFSLNYFSHFDAGYKCAAATLSDIAAMGAEPICLLVNLFCSKALDISELKELYNGMEEVCADVGAQIAGGDTVASEKLILSLTAIGQSSKPLMRSGARAGDLIYLSGYPGLSAVGQHALSQGLEGFDEAKKKHLRPKPLIRLGLGISDYANSCIDTSDGLSTDATRLARMSKVKIIIESSLLPLHPEVKKFSLGTGSATDSLILNAGEDYELLFSSPRQLPDEIEDTLVHRIGIAEEGEGLFLEANGTLLPLPAKGYDHFVRS